MDLEKLNLKENPFSNIVANANSKLEWAGMPSIKKKLQDSFDNCINNDSKELILNWGPYGGGKTFSSIYFKQKYDEDQNIIHVNVLCPKEGNIAVTEIFTGIIDSLSFEKISDDVREIINRIGKDEFIKEVTPISSSEFAKAIVLIGSEDDEERELMNRYLYAGLTKMELKKLGLAKGISTNSDTIKFLTGLIACYVHPNLNNSNTFVLWIDEMEDMIYYSAKHYKIFSQVLRDLFDKTSNSFLMVLNFTLAESAESSIELILGGAVWSRITKKIRFKQFEIEEAVNYYNELIKSRLINTQIEKPIANAHLKVILSNIPPSDLTPREINKVINSLISFALSKENEITENIINEWTIDYIENN